MQIRTEAYLLRGRAGAVALLAAVAALGLPLLHFSPGGVASQVRAPRLDLAGAKGAAIHFEPNQGQAAAQVRYVAHTSQGTLLFEPDRVSMLLRDTGADQRAATQPEGEKAVSFTFVGANAASVGVNHEGEALANYVISNDPKQWQMAIPTYGEVIYSDLYRGVTLRYEGTDGRLKGTYTVAPGSDPGRIRWQYTGADNLSVDDSGDLLVGLPGGSGGTLRELAPVAWQEIGGKRVPVQAQYSISKDSTVEFSLGAYNPAYALTIDPAITYSTYLGGTTDDYGSAIATDGAGNAYVVGYTNSTDFPTLNAYQGNKLTATDAFLSKFNPDGTLAFSTYFGGHNLDYGFGIAVDPAGSIYVTGYTDSNDLPVVNGYRAYSGGMDVFVAKFANNGQGVLYSTYLGGSSGNEYAYGIAADASGNAYVEGYTNSDDFPVLNAYQAARAGNFDAFVTRLNTNAAGDASLVYSTYLGGTNVDYGGATGFANFGHGVATDGAGNVYATGDTVSDDFPSRNAYQPTRDPSAGSDAWVAKINTGAAGNASLVYASFLGGNNSDAGFDIALDGANNAYVLGGSTSNNFPLRSSMSACTTNGQPFVAKFNMAASGDSSLIYSTCFGPSVAAAATDLAVNSSGEATVLGYSATSTWPLVNQIMSWSGAQDVVLAKLNAAGNGLIYSTYLGGSSNDTGRGLALDPGGYIYVTGLTQSSDFPTLNAYQPANRTHGDSFITRIDECPVTFTDVHITDYFYEAVRYLSCHGAVSGYADNTFRPFNNTTRGQLSKIVVLSEGWSIDTTGGPHFNDVPPSNPFYAYIETAFNHGIISGYSDGTFRQGNSVTRGQLCKIIVAAEGWPVDTTGGPHFNDVPTNNPFYAYIETAFNKGVVSGYSDGTFRWGNTATRGQICKIVYGAITSPR